MQATMIGSDFGNKYAIKPEARRHNFIEESFSSKLSYSSGSSSNFSLNSDETEFIPRRQLTKSVHVNHAYRHDSETSGSKIDHDGAHPGMAGRHNHLEMSTTVINGNTLKCTCNTTPQKLQPALNIHHKISNQKNEIIQARPLPLTPSEVTADRVTPQRYQNDSPFLIKRSRSQSSDRSLLEKEKIEKQKSAEEILRQVPWFKPKMSRDQVMELLSREDLGAFIIRESTTHDNCFALSVKVPKFNNPSGIAHYIIQKTESNGFKIKGLEKEWSNLSALVTHHTIMPELLPCTLIIPRPIMTSRQGSTTSRSSTSSGASRNSLRSSNASPSSSFSDRQNQIEKLGINLNKLHLTVTEAV